MSVNGSLGSCYDPQFYNDRPMLTQKPTGGCIQGLALNPFNIKHIIGVVKAYTTRVGGGPFPSEQEGDAGRKLQELGGEIGVSTGRRRRCGCKQYSLFYLPVIGSFHLQGVLQGAPSLLCFLIGVHSHLPKSNLHSRITKLTRKTTQSLTWSFSDTPPP